MPPEAFTRRERLRDGFCRSQGTEAGLGRVFALVIGIIDGRIQVLLEVLAVLCLSGHQFYKRRKMGHDWS